mgnify:CR=1 FL=1
MNATARLSRRRLLRRWYTLAGALLLAPFTQALHAACPRFDLRAPLRPPHLGAAFYAMHLARHG